MTECNGCGHCCDPVIFGHDPQEFAAARLADPHLDEVGAWARQQAEFLRENWHSESSFTAPDGRTVHRVRCDAYDRATRTCQAYENRPRVCSAFPWYDEAPSLASPQAGAMAPMCSYNADVRTMLPIVAVTHGTSS